LLSITFPCIRFHVSGAKNKSMTALHIAVLKSSNYGMRKEEDAHLCQVQNSWSMASKLCHLDHRGIFP
jgi:hypothetical protein